MPEIQPRVIDPNAVYTAQEVAALLRMAVSAVSVLDLRWDDTGRISGSGIMALMHRTARPRRRNEGKRFRPVVYLVACRELGRLKIGRSIDPRSRIYQLGQQSPTEYELVAVLPGDAVQIERQLHERFAHLNVRGEWFAAHPDIYAAFGVEPR